MISSSCPVFPLSLAGICAFSIALYLFKISCAARRRMHAILIWLRVLFSLRSNLSCRVVPICALTVGREHTRHGTECRFVALPLAARHSDFNLISAISSTSINYYYNRRARVESESIKIIGCPSAQPRVRCRQAKPNCDCVFGAGERAGHRDGAFNNKFRICVKRIILAIEADDRRKKVFFNAANC